MRRMNTPAFIHLRFHSEFSVTDGIVRIDDAVDRAKSLGMPALGISDLMNLFGLVKHYKACRGAGIKPIASVDAWFQNSEDPDKPFRAQLVAKNRAGYGRLCELLTRAYLENQTRGRAELRKEWLDSGDNSGLICLSGAHVGEIGQALLNGNTDQATLLAQWWQKRFPDAFYLELQRNGRPECEASVQGHLDIAIALDLPVVATHPIQFMDEDDFKAHEVRTCIAEGYVVNDKRRPRLFTEDQYFKTPAQMAALFEDVPEALANTVVIAQRCNLQITLGQELLAVVPHPSRDDAG